MTSDGDAASGDDDWAPSEDVDVDVGSPGVGGDGTGAVSENLAGRVYRYVSQAESDDFELAFAAGRKVQLREGAGGAVLAKGTYTQTGNDVTIVIRFNNGVVDTRQLKLKGDGSKLASPGDGRTYRRQ